MSLTCLTAIHSLFKTWCTVHWLLSKELAKTKRDYDECMSYVSALYIIDDTYEREVSRF